MIYFRESSMGCWEEHILCCCWMKDSLGSFNQWRNLVLGFLCGFFCFDDLSFGDRGVLKSPTTTVLESICAFMSFSVYLMKLGALTLGGYRLIIISFWCIVPFVSMECPSLSHLANVSLKSTLSDVNIATPVFFGGENWLGKPYPILSRKASV
jgi:hypothetical protein